MDAKKNKKMIYKKNKTD